MVPAGREVAWHRTGKALAGGVAREESRAAWEAVLARCARPG